MRPLTAAMETGMIQPVVRPIYLVRMDFDSGTVAWNSGFRNFDYDGATYVASGNLGSIGSVKEEPGVKAAGITITVSGIKPEIVGLLLSESYLGRRCLVHCALTEEDGLFDPDKCVLLFTGKLDAVTGISGKTASFSISVRSRLSDWERPRVLRYTDADQQKLYPGDKGMEFIPQLSQRKIIWPLATFLPDPRD